MRLFYFKVMRYFSIYVLTLFLYIYTDVTSPTFNNCPSDKVLSLGLCSSNITINWTPPVANDNSGSVRLHEPSLRPPVVLNEGIYIMNYTAVDDAGNSKTCLFKMQIISKSL